MKLLAGLLIAIEYVAISAYPDWARGQFDSKHAGDAR
jgi:hypothetical protein